MQELSPVRPANKTLTMIVLVMAFIYNVVFGFLRDPAGQKTALRLGCTCGFVGAHNFYLHRPLPAAGQALLFEVGLLFCLIPVTGVGRVNGVTGEDARVFLAAGFSMLGGVLLWAGHDVLELRRRIKAAEK